LPHRFEDVHAHDLATILDEHGVCIRAGHRAHRPRCGDTLTLQVRRDGDTITDAALTARACSMTQVNRRLVCCCRARVDT